MAAEPQLTPACELAFAVARDGVEASPPQEPPAPMRSFLYVAQLPRRALAVAQRVLDEDPAFRRTVAERATEENVGRAGWLWLHRPEGWEAEFLAIVGTAPQPPTVGRMLLPEGDDYERPPSAGPDPADAPLSISHKVLSPDLERELDGLRSLVDRLADERRAVSTSVQQLEAEINQRRSETRRLASHLDAMRAEREALGHERDRLRSALEAVVAERDEARERAEAAAAEAARARNEAGEAWRQRAALEAELHALALANAEAAAAHRGLVAEVVRHLEQVARDRDQLSAELEAANARLADLRQAVADAARSTAGEIDDGILPVLSSAARSASTLGAAVDEVGQRLADLQGAFDRAGAPADGETRWNPAGEPTSAWGQPDSAGGAPAPGDTSAGGAPAPGDTSAGGAPAPGDTSAGGAPAPGDTAGESAVESTAAEAPEPEAPGTGWSAARFLPPLPPADELFPDEPEARVEGRGADPEAPVGSGADVDSLLATFLPPEPPEGGEAAPAAGDEWLSVRPEGSPHPGGARTTSVDELDWDALLEPDRPAWTNPGEGGASTRRAPVVPDELRDDPLATARFLVAEPGVMLLVDGDAVAAMGWPTLTLAERRDALVTYLGELVPGSGAAPDVVFDLAVGGEASLPSSDRVRVRLTAPEVSAARALAELIDTYPVDWPVVVVTDDPGLVIEAANRGAAVLANVGLLDLFIAQ
jgi:regulator of replication initiation timing